MKRVVAVLGAALLAVAVLAGCSTDSLPFGSKTSAPTSVAEGQDGGGDVRFDANIGDCVVLSGSMMDAEIDHAKCGAAPANYKVIAKAATKEACPADADQTYYVTYGGKQEGALCLDIDWVPGKCMVLPSGSDEPKHVPCTAGESNTYRVLKIIKGTTDENQCPEPTSRYYSYDERKMVACVGDVE